MSSPIRKMILIPEQEMIQRLHLAQVPAEDKAAIQTEAQIDQLLMNQSVPKDLKVKWLNELFNRVQTLRHGNEQVAATGVAPAAGEHSQRQDNISQAAVGIPTGRTLDAEDVIRALGKTYRTRARRLLDFMEARGSPIKWDGYGRVEGIKGHIIDLLRYAVGRQGRPVNGWKEFSSQLLQASAPISLMSAALSASSPVTPLRSMKNKKPRRLQRKTTFMDNMPGAWLRL